VNIVELAQKLKATRLQRNLTLEEVATRAGLTRGWLSKVENFRVTPSLPSLSRICEAMNVTMSEIFEGIEAKPPLVVTKRGKGPVIRRDEDISQQAYESLAHDRPSREMDPFVVTVPPTDDRPMLTHNGEEFLMVLEGSIRLDYGEDQEKLEEGDSAYIDPTTPHRLACLSKKPAKVLVVFYGMDEGTRTLMPES